MFKRLLIANRGEIACRIIRTAQSMGIHCTHVFSTEDANSKAVRMADHAVCIGGPLSKDSYLNINKIIELATQLGIEAVHPGYGFLSENAEFAQACEKAGIIFVGPSPKALQSMASKQLAKQILQDTNVPMTPGYHGDEQSDKHLHQAAKKIGYPVLLKAAMGGGGKGMRAVQNDTEFSEALAAAKREALSSFGDDKIIIEKLIQSPRHVEVQIMADKHGNVVHCFERDCSIQRRHQKIIEEAPAPNLEPAIRDKMCQAAITVAKTIAYQGAGTVEFLLDKDGSFYFMEMNTRLQVEHPISEMITGLDFVRWQLDIAAGKPLPLSQEYIHCHGHAIECRIYAEDPSMNFMPSPGELTYLSEPDQALSRVDSGVEQGDQISQYYDPMIAKLITHGGNRTEAIHKMQRALLEYHIAGVKHNRYFLQALMSHPALERGDVDTGFLGKHALEIPKLDPLKALPFVACWQVNALLQQADDPIFQDSFAWQQNTFRHWNTHFKIDGQIYACQIQWLAHNQIRVTHQEDSFDIRWSTIGDEYRITTASGEESAMMPHSKTSLFLFHPQGQCQVEVMEHVHEGDAASHGDAGLVAPMPSSVVAILKQAGDKVKAGEALIILEAMKMEHTIHAPSDGCIASVMCSVGAQVNEGAQLISMEENCMESA